MIDGRTPNRCFVCGAAEEKSHIYHVMASSPLVYEVWPQIFQLMVACTGRHLTINDQLIFTNKVKPNEWKTFSKSDKLTALTLVSAGRNSLYKAYYTRLQGFPNDHKNLISDILQNEIEASKNIARFRSKMAAPILKAPKHLRRLGMTLESRIKLMNEGYFMKDKKGVGNGDVDDEISLNASFPDGDLDHGRGEENTATSNSAPPTSDATPHPSHTTTCPTTAPRRRSRRSRCPRLMTSPRLQAALDQAGQLPRPTVAS